MKQKNIHGICGQGLGNRLDENFFCRPGNTFSIPLLNIGIDLIFQVSKDYSLIPT